LLFLGKISKSRGNKGEVVCSISPEIDTSLVDFSGKIVLKSQKYTKTAKMESYSDRGSVLIAKFNISNSINDALRLVGYEVYIEESENDDSSMNLEGYSVFDINGLNWGLVSKVKLNGLNRLIEVEDGSDLIIIPFNNSIVLEIDNKNKKIVIDPPDGLKDLNR